MKTMKSENRSSHLKRLLIGLLVFLLGCYPSFVFALPNGGNIAGGTGSIGGTSQDMVVNQTSDKFIVNWNSFGIGSSESVQFIQPGSSSIALNRVIGVDPSNILGTLSGNGQIWIVNPNGVFFGSNSVVNAHGIFATTLDISDQDFLDSNNQYSFSQSGESLTSIINEGLIDVDDYAVLLAPTVINRGTILANLGHVALVSSIATTVDFTGDGLINFILDEGTSSEVTNAGLIQANGGQVLLSAKDAGGVIRSVVNNTGVIEANTVVEKEGKIILSGGDSGIVRNSGTLSASGDDAGEHGGDIELKGEYVEVLETAQINVSGAPEAEVESEPVPQGDGGLLLIEAGKSILFNAGLDTNGDVVMKAGSEGITINAPITAHTISLTSEGDININASLTTLGMTSSDGFSDILLIDDQGGFGDTYLVLEDDGHNVTVINYEYNSGYAHLTDQEFLEQFAFIIWGARGAGSGSVTPENVLTTLENYIQGGGNLLVTGYDTIGHPTDNGLANLIRSSTAGDQVSYNPNWITTSVDNFILNGEYGDYRDQSFQGIGMDDDYLRADTSRGAQTLVYTPGKSDKIIFTQLEEGGSVGYWNGGLSGTTSNAQPEFTLEGPTQNIFRNWADGAGSDQHSLKIVSGGNINIADGVTLNSADKLVLSADGGIGGSGVIDLIARNGIYINNDFSSTGTLNFNSDSDADGKGLLNLEEVIVSTTGESSDINIVAADLEFEELISEGDIQFTESTGRDLDIGEGDLANITATNLIVNTEGYILVSGVTAEDTQNISGTTTFNANGVMFGDYEYFEHVYFDEIQEPDFDGGYGSTFTNGLAVNAADGILIQEDLTSLAGGMSFNADSNNDGLGTFEINGVEVNSTNQMISITAADFVMARSLNAGVARSSNAGVARSLNAGAASSLIAGEGEVDISASAGRAVEISGEREIIFTDQIFALQSFDVIEFDGPGVMNISEYELGNITASNLTIRSDESITVDGGFDGIYVNNPVSLIAGNGIAMYGDFSTGGIGSTSFDSDSNKDGMGDFDVDSEASISTGNNPLIIVANDVDIAGQLNSGGVIVKVSDGGTIGLDGDELVGTGDVSTICGGDCGMTLNQVELDNMNSQLDILDEVSPGGIVIGDATAGDMTVNDINVGDQPLELVSGGVINDFDDGAPNIITTDLLVLRANGDIGSLGGPEGLNIDVGELQFFNGSDDNFTVTNLNSSGDDTFFGAVTEGTGNISYTLGNGDLLVDLVSTQGDVNLEATGGSVLDGNDVDGADNPGYLNVRGDTVTLTALSGIGEESNRLETDINTLNASTTGPEGNIYLHENDAIFLNDINTAGVFDINAGGNITEGNVNANPAIYNGAEQGVVDPEQEEDIDQGTTSTFLTEFFENVADNSGC